MTFWGGSLLPLKILLQRLWQLKIDWDQTIPENLHPKWIKWKEELPAITDFTIPRRYSSSDSPVRDSKLHGFSYASIAGYGAAIYLRVTHEDTTITVTLVTCKTRVSPLKALSIPKLELSGALLTAHLLVSTSKDLNLPNHKLYAWTSSWAG